MKIQWNFGAAQKWQNFTENNLQLQWPLWDTWNFLKPGYLQRALKSWALRSLFTNDHLVSLGIRRLKNKMFPVYLKLYGLLKIVSFTMCPQSQGPILTQNSPCDQTSPFSYALFLLFLWILLFFLQSLFFLFIPPCLH